MKRTYTGRLSRRLTISLTPEDEARLEYIYSELERLYQVTDKPSMSLLLLSVLKQTVETDPDCVPQLYTEVLEASKKKGIPLHEQLRSH